jgi:hypothetical protein
MTVSPDVVLAIPIDALLDFEPVHLIAPKAAHHPTISRRVSSYRG